MILTISGFHRLSIRASRKVIGRHMPFTQLENLQHLETVGSPSMETHVGKHGPVVVANTAEFKSQNESNVL